MEEQECTREEWLANTLRESHAVERRYYVKTVLPQHEHAPLTWFKIDEAPIEPGGDEYAVWLFTEDEAKTLKDCFDQGKGVTLYEKPLTPMGKGVTTIHEARVVDDFPRGMWNFGYEVDFASMPLPFKVHAS